MTDVVSTCCSKRMSAYIGLAAAVGWGGLMYGSLMLLHFDMGMLHSLCGDWG